jgi:CheY-like chemotaxis protein
MSALHAEATNGSNVLVIDDVQSTRNRLAQLLTTRGYNVLQASNGRQGIEQLLLSPHVDAILLDLVMPSMSGWEFRESQLRDARTASIPTIVVTVKKLADYERYALRVGTATVINKPFEDEQVLAALSRICGTPEASEPAVALWRSDEGQPLFWSKRGHVACEQHVPERESPAWLADGWAAIPAVAGKHKIQYRCQYCEPGPIRHRKRRIVDA